MMNKVHYDLVAESIGDGVSLLYEREAIAHLPVWARLRLAELSNLQSEIDYEACEAQIIKEGLYTPESEAQND
jgi:hypothetical protein